MCLHKPSVPILSVHIAYLPSFRYARKDRRPLDPPPVVQLKLMQLKFQGQVFERFEEYDKYDDAQGFGLLCHIDLFPVPPQDEPPDPASSPNKRRRKSPSASRPTTATTPAASVSPTPAPSVPSTSSPPYNFAYPASSSSPPAYTLPPPPPLQYGMASGHHTYSASSTGSGSSYTQSNPPPTGPLQLPPIRELGDTYQRSSLQLPPMQGTGFSRSGRKLPPLPPGPPPTGNTYSYPPPAPPPPAPQPLHPPPQPTMGGGSDIKAVPAGLDAPEGVVAYLGDFAIKEDSKCTDSLSGACFAQSQSLEYHGRKVLMFVFADIAVRIEGTFILRYRVFNIFARAEGMMDIPILAECYGGPFRIYSTKEFPGLRPSTDLTKHLSLFGVRLNLRETERKRRRGTGPGEGEGTSGRGRRRRRPQRGGDDDESDEGSGAGSGDDEE
ncbi:hypothetical protein BDW22DRAFT_1360183 [Trametopsis cervina]|nr:hypothetical protein BDW22DRAFT_1360183 [Trametopsis cervina]